jgi:hypothetical protein
MAVFSFLDNHPALFANMIEYAMIGADFQKSSEQHKAIIEAEGGC